jgi:formylglycine-generating enzyme required for sulfatase activity
LNKPLVVLSLLLLSGSAFADPLDDALELVEQGRPCRAIDAFESAASQGFAAPAGVVDAARAACQQQRRDSARRERERALAAEVQAVLDEAQRLLDSDQSCDALAVLEREYSEEVTSRLTEARSSASARCGADQSSESARLEALRALVISQMEAGDWVRVTAGRYTIGTEAGEGGREPDEGVTEVVISHDYYIQPNEVSQGAFRDLLETSPARFGSCGDNCPIESISWYDAVTYANTLSTAQSLTACYELDSCRGTPGDGLRCSRVEVVAGCNGYRLPTEAEWEIAARAGTTAAFSCGGTPCVEDAGWSSANADGTTHPGGSLRGNPWGINDVHGNVSEWTHSQYNRDLNGDGDPTSGVCSLRCAVRGGAYNSDAIYLRSGARSYSEPDRQVGHIGFRLVRAVP